MSSGTQITAAVNCTKNADDVEQKIYMNYKDLKICLVGEEVAKWQNMVKRPNIIWPDDQLIVCMASRNQPVNG